MSSRSSQKWVVPMSSNSTRTTNSTAWVIDLFRAAEQRFKVDIRTVIRTGRPNATFGFVGVFASVEITVRFPRAEHELLAQTSPKD